MDRDGTVNKQMGYINHLNRFVILPKVPEAIKLLNENGFFAIIVSNQSGVARGYFPMDLVEEVHTHLKTSLKEKGAHLDGIYYCPHYPGGDLTEFCYECGCRKPKTGLIDQARKAFDIDMERSYVIGDRLTDIEFANHSDLKGILVKTGYGLGEVKYILPDSPVKPVFIASDLFEAVRWILDKKG